MVEWNKKCFKVQNAYFVRHSLSRMETKERTLGSLEAGTNVECQRYLAQVSPTTSEWRSDLISGCGYI